MERRYQRTLNTSTMSIANPASMVTTRLERISGWGPHPVAQHARVNSTVVLTVAPWAPIVTNVQIPMCIKLVTICSRVSHAATTLTTVYGAVVLHNVSSMRSDR